MNAAKKRVMDIIEQLPDDIQNEYDVLDHAYIMTRLEQSRESIAKNGGIPHGELKAYMDEQRRILAEGRR